MQYFRSGGGGPGGGFGYDRATRGRANGLPATRLSNSGVAGGPAIAHLTLAFKLAEELKIRIQELNI